MGPVIVTYEPSVPAQQERWFAEALSACTFPLDRGELRITVRTLPEPPAPGHQDYMCTQTAAGVSTITIREGADDPARPFNAGRAGDLQASFMESVVHELGHAFIFTHMAVNAGAIATIASWFYRHGATGEGIRVGQAADWSPLDRPWEDRVQEGAAEFFKDLYMPGGRRVFENRTNWWLDRSKFGAFMDAVEATICSSGGQVNV